MVVLYIQTHCCSLLKLLLDGMRISVEISFSPSFMHLQVGGTTEQSDDDDDFSTVVDRIDDARN